MYRERFDDVVRVRDCFPARESTALIDARGALRYDNNIVSAQPTLKLVGKIY